MALKKRIWGFMEDGVFIALPHWPGWDEEPPCDVTLPSGVVRHVIWEPASATLEEITPPLASAQHSAEEPTAPTEPIDILSPLDALSLLYPTNPAEEGNHHPWKH